MGFHAKIWYHSWYHPFVSKYQYQYRYRTLPWCSISISIGIEFLALNGISISIGIELLATGSISIVSVSKKVVSKVYETIHVCILAPYIVHKSLRSIVEFFLMEEWKKPFVTNSIENYLKKSCSLPIQSQQ